MMFKEQLRELIKKREEGSYLYTENLAYKFNTTYNQILYDMAALEQEDLVEVKYKAFCPRCSDFARELYNTPEDVDGYCEECDAELSSKYTYKVFKVKHYGG